MSTLTVGALFRAHVRGACVHFVGVTDDAAVCIQGFEKYAVGGIFPEAELPQGTSRIEVDSLYPAHEYLKGMISVLTATMDVLRQRE